MTQSFVITLHYSADNSMLKLMNSFFLRLDLFKKRIRFMFKDEDLKLNTMVETEIFQRGATIKKI
jgi:hypothetical protein